MNPRTLCVVCLLLLCAQAQGAGDSYRWRVMKRLVIDPVAGQRTLRLLPVRCGAVPGTPAAADNLYVEGEPEPVYLQGRSQRQRRSWEEDKQQLCLAFTRTVWQLVGKQIDLGGDGLRVQPALRHILPGWPGPNFGTQVVLSLQLLSDAGVVDEVELPVSVQSPALFSVGARLREAGRLLGEEAARYLALRALADVPRGGGATPLAGPGLAVRAEHAAAPEPVPRRWFASLKLGPRFVFAGVPTLFELTVEPGVQLSRRLSLRVPVSFSLSSGLILIDVPVGLSLDVPLFRGLLLSPGLSLGYTALLAADETQHFFAITPEIGLRYELSRLRVGLDAVSVPILTGRAGTLISYRLQLMGGLRF